MHDELLSRLQLLRQHTEPPTAQPREQPDIYDEADELNARRQLAKWGLPCPGAPAAVSAAIKSQVVRGRVFRTTRSRVTEIEISNLIAQSHLPRLVMHLLFTKLVALFENVHRLSPTWFPSKSRLQELCYVRDSGNHREQFHTIRDALPELRDLLQRLAKSHVQSDVFLLYLGSLGVLNPDRVLFLVDTAFQGDVSEILSPPAELRRIWKPVARERIAPEDGDELGPFTTTLWSASLPVRDVSWPPISEAEIKRLFGDHASLSSHGIERLPYACGAHKYRLVEHDPVVLANTAKKLFMTSGPSGTAYRFLNLWVLFNGSEEDLASVRFAVTSLLLNDRHHSLVEVLSVCAPFMGHDTPGSLEEMIDQLVPHDLEITNGKETCFFSRKIFRAELSQSVDLLLGTIPSVTQTVPLSMKEPRTAQDFKLAAVRGRFLGMREVTGLQDSEPSSLEDCVSFCWPSSAPPSKNNLNLAERLGQQFTSDLEYPVAAAFGQAGWSAQDCIKVVSGRAKFIIKVPRDLSDATAVSICLSEAARTSWAASKGLGPQVRAIDPKKGAFAVDFIAGKTLTKAVAQAKVTDIVSLLHEFHDAAAAPWMKEYKPLSVVRQYLEQAKLQDNMVPRDILVVEAVLSEVTTVLDTIPHRPVPCHNDFHCQNIMLDATDGRLWAIDYENCDLADPMWDLAYLTVDLDLEPLGLADVYGCTGDEKTRLKVYHLLALAHCAVWCANRGPLWVGHYRLLMGRLENVRRMS